MGHQLVCTKFCACSCGGLAGQNPFNPKKNWKSVSLMTVMQMTMKLMKMIKFICLVVNIIGYVLHIFSDCVGLSQVMNILCYMKYVIG